MTSSSDYLKNADKFYILLFGIVVLAHAYVHTHAHHTVFYSFSFHFFGKNRCPSYKMSWVAFIPHFSVVISKVIF